MPFSAQEALNKCFKGEGWAVEKIYVAAKKISFYYNEKYGELI